MCATVAYAFFVTGCSLLHGAVHFYPRQIRIHFFAGKCYVATVKCYVATVYCVRTSTSNKDCTNTGLHRESS